MKLNEVIMSCIIIWSEGKIS